ncbi:MAG: ankyrin repeat domain-containing protein [Armatimonadetes bacterium]|nr:ankyrin repeat domain-containing protein [Armatimonadota bacterium]
MHNLVRSGPPEALAAFLKANPKASNELDEDGRPPLHHVLKDEEPSPEIVRLLLEAGADPLFVYVDKFPEPPEGLDLDSILSDELDLDLPSEMISGSYEIREPLFELAILQGDFDTVRLFVEHGADVHAANSSGYSSLLSAVYGRKENLPLIEYLIGLGVDLMQPSQYGERPLTASAKNGKYSYVKALVEAGAHEGVLQWTPLIRSVAIGSIEDVERELTRGPDLEARDASGHTAMDVAILKGDIDAAMLLRSSGAAFSATNGRQNSAVCLAVLSGSTGLVQWLVAEGCPVDSVDRTGDTALVVAVHSGDAAMIRTLLDLGADPNFSMDYSSVFDGLVDKESIISLLSAGADPTHLRSDNIRAVLGFGRAEFDSLDSVTVAEYRAAKDPREGRSNPEDMTGPFKVAMVKSGFDAYGARQRFNDPSKYVCPVPGSRGTPVWCAARFGQSMTILPDGRVVLIAGEHEDWYDPDFCIYNDVIVGWPDGELRIYGYPFSVFPPTDFHTATLLESSIAIIGGLGCLGERQGDTPVLKLSTNDFRMEPVATSGPSPGRVFKHRAELSDGKIKVWGGQVVRFIGGKEEHVQNTAVHLLDLATMTWTAVEVGGWPDLGDLQMGGGWPDHA